MSNIMDSILDMYELFYIHPDDIEQFKNINSMYVFYPCEHVQKGKAVLITDKTLKIKLLRKIKC